MLEISSIISAVQVPALVKDPFMSGASFEMSGRRLVHHVGGFTVVFPCRVGKEKWAFRCWHNLVGSSAKRFQIISDAISKAQNQYLSEFVYCDNGIMVDGQSYPTTRMRWVEGDNLKDYICKHRTSTVLQQLASDFLSMCKSLHSINVAHGDLQHGNIIVDGNGNLTLIDYDSLYVPELRGVEDDDVISGKAEYQHPARSKNRKANEKLDYFSELVIYLSLMAMAKDLNLIDTYNVADTDALLFSKNDFADIKSSKIYADIQHLGDDNLSLLLEILKIYLEEDDINNLKPFYVLQDELTREPQIVSFKCREGDEVYIGDILHIDWEVVDARKILFGRRDYTGKTSTEEHIHTAGTKQYVLRAQNISKECKKEIKVNVHPTPAVKISASALTLRKSPNEKVRVKWDATNAMSVALKTGSSAPITVTAKGEQEVHIDETTTFTLIATGLDGKRTFDASVQVEVFEEAKIEFALDKQYSLPGVPIYATWDVRNAKVVKLNDEEVPHKGTKRFEARQDTTYVLSVEDQFGVLTRERDVHMLPLPSIQRVMVPEPNLNVNVDMQVSVPEFKMDMPLTKVDIKMPNITFDVHPQKVELENLGRQEEDSLHFVKQNARWQELRDGFLKSISNGMRTPKSNLGKLLSFFKSKKTN